MPEVAARADDHLGKSGTGARSRPAFAGQVGKRYLRAASEVMIVRDGHQNRVMDDVAALERRIAGARGVLVLFADGEIDRTLDDEGQGFLRLRLEVLDGYPGVIDCQMRQRAGKRATATVWKDATRTVPRGSALTRATSASARSMRARRASAWSTRSSAASVRRTFRPTRSSSSTPASRSSCESCCETADGLYERASATAAIVPRA
jgi:hypothetical protein